MQPHHIALFPELYAHKPKLSVIVRGAQNLRKDPQNLLHAPLVYCVCEIPGKPQSKFKTGIEQSLSPNWNHEQRVPHWENGNSLHFSVFQQASVSIQRGTLVRIVGMTTSSKLNGMVGHCSEWNQSRGAWMVAFEGSHQVPIKPENLEVADASAGADEFLGWCQIQSKKFIPDGFDGVKELHQSGSAGALIRIHIKPTAIGGILLHTEHVPDMPGGDGGHNADFQGLLDGQAYASYASSAGRPPSVASLHSQGRHPTAASMDTLHSHGHHPTAASMDLRQDEEDYEYQEVIRQSMDSQSHHSKSPAHQEQNTF